MDAKCFAKVQGIRSISIPLTNRQVRYRDIVRSMISWRERSVVTLEFHNRSRRTKRSTEAAVACVWAMESQSPRHRSTPSLCGLWQRDHHPMCHLVSLTFFPSVRPCWIPSSIVVANFDSDLGIRFWHADQTIHPDWRHRIIDANPNI